MSIETAIQAAQQKVANAYTAASAKGATMPTTQNLSNLATTIGSISGGGVDTTGWIPKTIDANGKLNASSATPNFTGVQDVGDYVLYGGERGNTSLTGAVSFPDLTTVSGDHAMSYMFCDCTGLTSVDLSGLTTISGNYAMGSAFSSCTGLTSADLSSLTSVGDHGLDFGFKDCTGLTSADLSSLTSVGPSGLYCAFNGCTGLISADLSGLTNLINYNALNRAFTGCFGLTSVDVSNITDIGRESMPYTFENCSSLKNVVFSSLARIAGASALERCFKGCVGLRYLIFPSLTQVAYTSAFDYMLSGVSGCTVIFPLALESAIGNWTSVKNGFGGSNTRVIFGEVKNVQVSIPQGYTVYFNDENITSSTEVIALVGNNNVEGIDNAGRAFKYTFVADSTTTTFTPDVSGLVFNEFQLTSNESGVVFEPTVNVGSLTVDTNNKVYATAGFSLTADGIKEGFIGFPITVSTDSSATLNVQMFADSNVIVLDSSNIVSLASGDTSYLSVDTTDNLIKYGSSAGYITAASVQIALTPPAGTTNMQILTGAYTSTEENYDFGYISLGTQRVTPSYNNVKSGTIANGSYLFRDSGVKTSFTPVDTGTLDQTNLVLSIGIAEDSSIKGTNTLYVQPIKVFFW